MEAFLDKEKATKTNRMLLILVAVLLIVAIVVGLLVLKRVNNTEAVKQDAPTAIGGGEPIPEDKPIEKNETGIALPGYVSITLKAGQKQQELTIPNPSENTCLIRISLILEDGTTIWTSELVEPGYYCKPVVLIAPMERGKYKNVKLKYECFTNDDKREPLNGAQTTIDIIVL